MVLVPRHQRLPPQGGLPPADGIGGTVVEIACDESGFSGRNLLDAATPLFTHASVDLGIDEAEELIGTLRSGLRWSLSELKSTQFLRGPHAGEALEWFLAALNGRAHVHLIDKEYFLVTRIVDLLLAEPSYAAGTRLNEDRRPAALALYRTRRAAGRQWSDFLSAFVDLAHTEKRQQPEDGVVERFLDARDRLAAIGLDDHAEAVLAELTRTRVSTVASRLAGGDRSIPPPLEPMLPALAETVLFWSGGQRQVLVVHDEQSALTASRLRRLQVVVPPLAGLVTVDSRDDPRVQVADLLAGVARRPPGHIDGLLQAFVSPTSLLDPEQ